MPIPIGPRQNGHWLTGMVIHDYLEALPSRLENPWSKTVICQRPPAESPVKKEVKTGLSESRWAHRDGYVATVVSIFVVISSIHFQEYTKQSLPRWLP